jgi:iron-sulfur cluster assembly protein
MSDVTITEKPNLNQIVSITPSAIEKLTALLQDEPDKADPMFGLRLGVIGGGCSGFSYKLKFGLGTDADNVVDNGAFKVYIDKKSTIYLRGIQLDYQGGLDGKGFVFQNPNATNTCGCGESFSV